LSNDIHWVILPGKAVKRAHGLPIGSIIMTVKLGMEIAPLLLWLQDALTSEPDPVRQQQCIEMLMAGHAMRMSNQAEGRFVIDSMSKHAKQLLAQYTNGKL
jgi:hypothetical protein